MFRFLLVLACVSLVRSQSPPFASVQTSVSFRGGNSPFRTFSSLLFSSLGSAHTLI
jgi:hypothetical protein